LHRQQFEKDKQNVDVAPPGKFSADALAGLEAAPLCCHGMI